MNGIKWFTSAGWTQMRPNGNAGMFGGMGTDAVFKAQLNSDGTEIMMVPKQQPKTRTATVTASTPVCRFLHR